jgi:hypothetical protein
VSVEYGVRLFAPDEAIEDPRALLPPHWRGLLPPGTTAALYFGTEFCEDRLPDVDEAEAYCSRARDEGLAPTLLTPLVSPGGLVRMGRLLHALAQRRFAPAVVFNDWGVLELLRERHPGWRRRAGRLLNRSLRDPRAYRDAPQGPATHDASRYARVRQMLRGLGVEAVESDADLEGGFLGDGRDGRDGDETGLDRALHLPFTYAASGRGCPLKAALYPDGGGFTKAFADPCPAPCRGRPLPVARDDTTLPHWRAGNTVFYELPAEAATGWLAHAERIVVHRHATP